MKQLKFIILDGYPKESREQFDEVGMTRAGKLYARMLLKYLPDAKYDIFYSSDPGVTLPDAGGVKEYDGVLWPGCNLTVYHDHDERVRKWWSCAMRPMKPAYLSSAVAGHPNWLCMWPGAKSGRIPGEGKWVWRGRYA